MKRVILFLILIIVLVGCTKTQEQDNKKNLSNCEKYYDGCNTCDVENGRTLQCTERVCQTYEEAKCIEPIVEEQNTNAIENNTQPDLPINEARGDYEVRRQVMEITSSAFSDNGIIPVKYTCDGSDTVPPLNFQNIPENTSSLVLIMDDPDAVEVSGVVWDHWVVFNIPPATTSVQEGQEPNGILGKSSSNTLGYEGPCPPEEHEYYFKLYALDTMLNLQEGATKQQVENAMQDHILAQATLVGKYAPQ